MHNYMDKITYNYINKCYNVICIIHNCTFIWASQVAY